MMTGQDLQQLLLNKWGKSYDIRFRRVEEKIFLQIFWKYLEQVSFPMTENDYLQHLQAIAHYLNTWGVTQQVQDYITTTRHHPRVGSALTIPLDLGERASEWLL